MKRILMTLTILAAFVLGLQACSKKPAPQDSCNFVQNSQLQRVSWKGTTPITLYVDKSFPSDMYPAAQAAAKDWNDTFGRELIHLAGWTSKTGEPGQDGSNIIYWRSTWDANRTDEQARTTVYWVGETIYEADIMVNARDFIYAASATTKANTVDIESLLVHEMGHVLGLAHTEVTKSVMLKSLPKAFLRRTPQEFDLNSIRCEY
jgi:hypothetical protein